MNCVQLIGNVGNDPELRYTTAGQPVVNLSLASNEVFTDKQGQRQKRTEWHRLVFWGKIAETTNKYVRKGDKVGVQGKLQSRKWVDNAGANRTSVEVVVINVDFLTDHRLKDGEETTVSDEAVL